MHNSVNLQAPPSDDAARLRSFCFEAGYTAEGLREVLVANELPSLKRRNLPFLLFRARGRSARDILARWFAVGAAVEEGEVREVIPDWFQQICLAAGLLAKDGDTLVPRVTLVPFQELLVASDLSLVVTSTEDPGLVLGLNATTWLLHRFTIRRPSRATLDLGTGCGFQALASAAHSESVVATDLNPRATDYARFNAALNGLSNVRCLTGDAFAPVAGQSFDLIVANPPFFITPSRGLIAVENRLDLDHFCKKLVREAAIYLHEGGCFQMVCEWAETGAESWQEKLGQWFDGIGCDAWLLKQYTEDPSVYAHNRMRETTSGSPETDLEKYREWMEYYEKWDVRAIHGGLVAMRRRSGRNWVRIDDNSPRSPRRPFGHLVLQGFLAKDLLEKLSSDADLLEAKPSPSQQLQVDRRFCLDGGKWKLDASTLLAPESLVAPKKLDGAVLDFISRFDGNSTLRQHIRDFTEDVAAPAEKVERECLAVVRTLIEQGFIRVA